MKHHFMALLISLGSVVAPNEPSVTIVQAREFSIKFTDETGGGDGIKSTKRNSREPLHPKNDKGIEPLVNRKSEVLLTTCDQ
jgi:hypothetical protein